MNIYAKIYSGNENILLARSDAPEEQDIGRKEKSSQQKAHLLRQIKIKPLYALQI